MGVLLKILLVLVAVFVGIPVLVVGSFWLYLTIHPSDVRTEQITWWCRLRRSDPSVDWPHLLRSAPFEDEVLVNINGDWTSAATDRRMVGSRHWGAIVLAGGQAVVVGFDNRWNLFTPGRATPVLSGGWTKEEGDCRPVALPSARSFICLRSHTEYDDRERARRTTYTLESIDLDGQREALPVTLPERPKDPDITSSWDWEIHGFASDGAPILVQQLDRRHSDSYTCRFARLEGARVKMVGDVACELSKSSAPPGIEAVGASTLPP